MLSFNQKLGKFSKWKSFLEVLWLCYCRAKVLIQKMALHHCGMIYNKSENFNKAITCGALSAIAQRRFTIAKNKL
jgi:hypothetical protein